MKTPSWKQTLIFLSIAQFISMVGMSFFLPFIPLYLGELGVEGQAELATWSGIMFSSGFLMLSLVAPFWGSVADQMGRKLMVLRAMAAASVVLLLTAFVQNHYQLLFLRLVHGCFSGFVSSAMALIASETPERSLGISLGSFQSAITSGFIVGPSLGGFLQDQVGIRPTIMLGSLLVFMGTIVVFFGVRETHKPKKNQARPSLWKNVAFVFRNQTLRPAARIQFLSNMALMSVIPLLALFVENLHQDSDNIGSLTGLVISGAAFSMIFGAPFWGKMVDRIGQKKVLTICLIMAGVSFVPQSLSTSIPWLFASRVFLGFFAAGIAPSLQVLIANHAEMENRAGIMGVGFSLSLMGNALGPLLGGLMGAMWGIRAPFLIMGSVLLFSAWLSSHMKIRLAKAPPALLAQSD